MTTVLLPLAEGCEELEAVTDTTLDEALQRDYDMVVLPRGAKAPAGSRPMRVCRRCSRAWPRTADTPRPSAQRPRSRPPPVSGKRATAYPGILQGMALHDVTVRDTGLERDGKMITSRGPGTAMDFALRLIELLEGQQKRDEVEVSASALSYPAPTAFIEVSLGR